MAFLGYLYRPQFIAFFKGATENKNIIYVSGKVVCIGQNL